MTALDQSRGIAGNAMRRRGGCRFPVPLRELAGMGVLRSIAGVMKARRCTAVILVGIAGFSVGVFCSYVHAYFLALPHGKFGPETNSKIGAIASVWLAVCIAIDFLVSLPLYNHFFSGRGVRHLASYSAAFVAAFSAAGLTGAMSQLSRLVGILAFPFIRTELFGGIAASLAASVLAATAFCIVAWWTDPWIRRSASTSP